MTACRVTTRFGLKPRGLQGHRLIRPLARLYSVIGHTTPAGFIAGRGKKIWGERDRRLEAHP